MISLDRTVYGNSRFFNLLDLRGSSTKSLHRAEAKLYVFNCQAQFKARVSLPKVQDRLHLPGCTFYIVNKHESIHSIDIWTYDQSQVLLTAGPGSFTKVVLFNDTADVRGYWRFNVCPLNGGPPASTSHSQSMSTASTNPSTMSSMDVPITTGSVGSGISLSGLSSGPSSFTSVTGKTPLISTGGAESSWGP